MAKIILTIIALATVLPILSSCGKDGAPKTIPYSNATSTNIG